MGHCTIYRITNLVNGKIYIGQTWQPLKVRFRQHKEQDRTTRGCVKLGRAFARHGDGFFRIEPIGTASSQAGADFLEGLYIISYNSIEQGYNLRGGGQHGRPSEETRAKLRAYNLGRKRSDEHRANNRAAHLGRKCSDQAKAKLRAANLGKGRSEETRLKNRAANLGRKPSEEARAKMRASQKNRRIRERVGVDPSRPRA